MQPHMQAGLGMNNAFRSHFYISAEVTCFVQFQEHSWPVRFAHRFSHKVYAQAMHGRQ